MENSKQITKSNFITNRKPNSLENNFKNILNSKNIKNLAFLVGFFRFSGFNKLYGLIENDINRFGTIRILVGMEVDEILAEMANSNQNYSPFWEEKFKSKFYKKQREFIQNSDYGEEGEVDKSLDILKQALQDKKIEIKMIREKNVHAKFYVFYGDPNKDHAKAQEEYYYDGALVVGSSNLTENGLNKNYEVNLITKDSDDITYALNEFEDLWEKAIEININDIQESIKDTFIDILTPEEIYYKLLLEYFGEESFRNDNSLESLFGSYKPYQYQIHAINEGIAKLKKYNGFFLSDVVGLGKTIIALVIAKKFQLEHKENNHILVLCPPALKNSWNLHSSNLGIPITISTHDGTNKLKDTDRFGLVIIDESHNFRNSSANRYDKVQTLCKSGNDNKRVILLSATPQNNSPMDIYNQICLFLDEMAGFEAIPNIKNYFNDKEKIWKEIKIDLKQDDKRENAKERLKQLSDKIRNDVLIHIMVRRTRTDIEELYKEDMKKQGLSFPKIENPKDLSYNLDIDTDDLAKQTIVFLFADDEFNDIYENKIGKYGYYRYLIYPNLNENGKEKYRNAYGGGESAYYEKTAGWLRGLVMQLLFKRFDSSIEAFKATIQKQIIHNKQLIDMLKQGEAKLPKNYNNRDKLYEAIADNDFDTLEALEEQDKIITLDISDFQVGFLENLENDQIALRNLLDKWQSVKSDPKLNELKEFLNNNKNKKIVIFTEAQATAKYLQNQLQNNYTILQIDSKNRDELEHQVRENFDANYDIKKQKDDYSIIVSTDTLAEGVNLHRSNIIINYDTPYNATRLMQRIGRINRVGTQFDNINIYNFKPTYLTDKIINIVNIAFQKIQSFHYTFGEDSAIYTQNEEVDTKKLFDQALKGTQGEQSPDTKYRKDLLRLYNENYSLYKKIKALPNRVRTIIQAQETQSFVYIKQTRQNITFDERYIIKEQESNLEGIDINTCDFITMADFLNKHKKSKINAKYKNLHNIHIKQIINYHNGSMNLDFGLDKPQLPREINNAIKKVQSCLDLTQANKDILLKTLKQGKISQLPSKIKKAKNAEEIIKLIDEYNLHSIDSNNKSMKMSKMDIQLSITAVKNN